MKVIKDIWYGSNTNAWLSNLEAREFWLWSDEKMDSLKYVSVEHAYQTLKSERFDEKCYNRPWKAGSKFIGDYQANFKTNVYLMHTLIWESFLQNETRAEQLRETWPEVFTHNKDRGIWKTEFPRILTEVRKSLLIKEEM